MSSKESAKFWHEKCQVLETKVAELEKEKREMKSKVLYLRGGIIHNADEMKFILDKLLEVADE
jgi:hypothetical protein